jgi:hypothetical protein
MESISMESVLEQELKLKFPPLALLSVQQLMEGTKIPKVRCAMHVFAQAAKGNTVAVSPGSCSCPGANSGLGLCSASTKEEFPGGPECMLRFLSTGNQDWEKGRVIAKELEALGQPKDFIETFLEGERFKKSPELVAQYFDAVPKLPVEAQHIVIKPLRALEQDEKPRAVTLLADADQLSALVVLANFARPGLDSVRIPFSAGCASLALIPFYEATQPNPRAVIGLTDISARFYLGTILGRDVLSFTMPWGLFLEMEENVPQSFLSRSEWKTVAGRRQG